MITGKFVSVESLALNDNNKTYASTAYLGCLSSYHESTSRKLTFLANNNIFLYNVP